MPAFVFISVIVIFLLASGYIAARVCRAMRHLPLWSRLTVWGVVLLLDFSFVLSRLLPHDHLWLGRAFYVVSTEWLTVVLYASVTLFLMDVVSASAYHVTRKKPYSTTKSLRNTAFIVAALMLYSHLNALYATEKNYQLTSPALAAGTHYRIGVVSDLHMGYAVGRSDMARLVDNVNNSRADMLLIVGDLIDGDLAPVTAENIGAELENLRLPMGTFAVMGNHDFMDDADSAARYIDGLKGVTLLRDTARRVGPFNIIGRDDVSGHRFAKDGRPASPRKTIDALGIDPDRMNIVMDHQPSGIDDAVSAGADLFLAGHTHAGQIWPMRLFTRLLFKLDYGLACFESTCAIVTSGYGTWGPRQRLGTDSEIVYIDIYGTKTDNNKSGAQ